MFSLFI